MNGDVSLDDKAHMAFVLLKRITEMKKPKINAEEASFLLHTHADLMLERQDFFENERKLKAWLK